MELKSGSYFLIIFVMSFVLVACGSSSEGSETAVELPTSAPPDPAPTTVSAPTAAPMPAPGFTLSTLYGEEISLSDYEGEWVILNFWATWCPPCVAEMPYLQTLSDRGLNVLGVNMTDTPEAVEQFTAKHGIKFPILMEPDINTVLDYQARQLPRTVIIAPDGNIALRIAGAIDGERLNPWLETQGVH
jgi:peroxiredoxin